MGKVLSPQDQKNLDDLTNKLYEIEVIKDTCDDLHRQIMSIEESLTLNDIMQGLKEADEKISQQKAFMSKNMDFFYEIFAEYERFYRYEVIGDCKFENLSAHKLAEHLGDIDAEQIIKILSYMVSKDQSDNGLMFEIRSAALGPCIKLIRTDVPFDANFTMKREAS
ncbi:hypothetical protein ACMXYX_17895 (plasmid) [Neptuniibacter sp. QD72_48]|uniref:hypothetical protein n=1 Tax=Neptuniibacter sp. QD72_48 TaxID=3398214 RepID=UPI0039F4C8A7